MSNHQRLMKKGKLEELREKLNRLEHRAESAVESLQIATFVNNSALDLDGEKIVLVSEDLSEIINQASSVRRQITKLEDELGG